MALVTYRLVLIVPLFIIVVMIPHVPVLVTHWHIVYVSLVAMAGVNFFVAHWQKYLVLKKSDFCLCKSCGYYLLQINIKGKCPECGESYVLDELKQQWQRRYVIMNCLFRR